MIDSGTATVITGFGVAGVVQFAGLLVWGSALNQRVKVLEVAIQPVIALRLEVGRLGALLETLDKRLGELTDALNDRPRLPPRRRGGAPTD